jgi:hypothetical protein
MAGRPPFRAKTVGGVVFQHLYDTPPPPSSFVGDPARAYDDLILQLLRKEPAERPESMRRLLDEFQDHLGGRVVANDERGPSLSRICQRSFHCSGARARRASTGVGLHNQRQRGWNA